MTIIHPQPQTSTATVIVTYIILALLLGILVFAHPRVRQKYHDNFEVAHRFLGWTGTALVWVQVRQRLVGRLSFFSSSFRLFFSLTTTKPLSSLSGWL